jgi:hypothetical protein
VIEVVVPKNNAMKKILVLTPLILLVSIVYSNAQEIQTLFKPGKSGGYGAISNKFTTIGGNFANIVEGYGGWFINNRLLIGIGGAGLTNDVPVSPQFSNDPSVDMSYAYGQFGAVNEYVLWSDKVVHGVFHVFAGAGFTGQYERFGWDSGHDIDGSNIDEQFFFVLEPGVQIELNLMKWLRFSPGVTYRAAFGSDTPGLSDSDLSAVSYNLTLKFGKF